MANKKISDLPAASSVDSVDLFEIEQGGSSKSATAAQVVGSLGSVVTGPNSSTDGNVAVFDGTAGNVIKDGGTFPTGDVVGPVSALDGHLALFDGITGKLIKDGGAPATGNVTGPVSSVDGDLAVFNGTTGKILKTNGPIGHTVTVYASGSVYSLTATDAAVDFGGTDPNLTIDKAGTYLIFGRAKLKYTGATFAGNETAVIHLRRINNTPADISNATSTTTLRIITTTTDSAGEVNLPPVVYTTVATNDSISVYGSLSNLPSAGSVDVTEASIVVIKIR